MVQIQPRKLALDHAECTDCTAPTGQHEIIQIRTTSARKHLDHEVICLMCVLLIFDKPPTAHPHGHLRVGRGTRV